MGWRECYIDKHKDVAGFATHVVQQFSDIEIIEIGQYLSVIEEMCWKELGPKDVQMFFFKQNISALINLIGLHYCISWLGVPAAHVGEALDSCKISQRVVCVRRKGIIVGQRRCGFVGMHGYFCHTFSLADIASGNEEEALEVLRDRVPTTERFHVQISVKNLNNIVCEFY